MYYLFRCSKAVYSISQGNINTVTALGILKLSEQKKSASHHFLHWSSPYRLFFIFIAQTSLLQSLINCHATFKKFVYFSFRWRCTKVHKFLILSRNLISQPQNTNFSLSGSNRHIMHVTKNPYDIVKKDKKWVISYLGSPAVSLAWVKLEHVSNPQIV